MRNRRTSGDITRGEKFWDCLDHPLVIQYAWGQLENTHRSTGSFILDDHRHRPRLSASHSIRHIRASRGVQASVRSLATWEAHALQCTLVSLRKGIVSRTKGGPSEAAYAFKTFKTRELRVAQALARRRTVEANGRWTRSHTVRCDGCWVCWVHWKWTEDGGRSK